MFGRIKIRPADKLYSQWLRGERKVCERCGSTKSLQCSHFYGRANEAVRFDPANTDCLCFGCHQYFTANPNEYVIWKQDRMSEKEFKQLMVSANTYKKKDDKLILIWLKNKLGTMEQEKPKKVCIHKMKFPYCSLCFGRQPKKKKETKEIIE